MCIQFFSPFPAGGCFPGQYLMFFYSPLVLTTSDYRLNVLSMQTILPYMLRERSYLFRNDGSNSISKPSLDEVTPRGSVLFLTKKMKYFSTFVRKGGHANCRLPL